MNSEKYRYEAFDDERREIRLLTLSSGTHDEPLRCQLAITSLTNDAKYNALSYVWGAPAISKGPTILLDGHCFLVTSNLYSALQHLRPLRGSAPLCLWVDAVCINQEDVTERNEQVAMMRDIYASATQVMVWLGEEDEDSDAAFDAMPFIADKTSWFWQEADDVRDQDRSYIRQCCGDFFFSLQSSRSWFSRLWILQELAMARDDPKIVCGWKCVPWSTFIASWQIIAKSGSFGLSSMQKEHGSSHGVSQFLAQTKLDVLNNLRDVGESGTGKSLRELLLISRTSAATDPRDRVYGLLGLLDRDALDASLSYNVKVDYRKSCAEVYTDAMAHIFSRGDGPHFLSGMFLSGGSIAAPHIPSLSPSTAQPNLPSWVPDFSRQTFDTARQPTSLSFLPPATMSASGAGQGANNGRMLQDHQTLQVEGLVVDIIRDVIPFGSSVGAIVESLTHLEQVASEARMRPCLFDPVIASYMERLKHSEPLWRILISNKHLKSGYEPAPVAYKNTYLSYLTTASTEEKLSKHSDDAQNPEYEVALRSCVGRKSFFTTESGFVGTCTPASREGDIVVILFGSPAPFVLHQLPRLEGEELAYSLVGSCYVGGIMNGEMVDELYCEDLMDSTTFFIR